MRADPGTSEGCMRAYWYEYVKKLKPEDQGWLVLGRELHAQNEHYLLTGEKKMGPLAMAGLFMLPKPKNLDPRIEIEHEIGGGDLSKAPLRAAGIPVAGYIDCIHWQGTNPGGNDVVEAYDPPGTVEVIDWKTTGDLKWIKSAQDVSRTLQMTTYGKWAVEVKKAEHVRLSHGYYVTKGRHTPRKVTLRVHKDQINERWEYIEKLAGSLKEVVKETNPDRVPANTRACAAFRGCPHQRYCSAYSHNSLASILGESMASSLLGLDQDEILTIPTTEELTNQMTQPSLLSKLQQKPDVKSEMKRLALEEVNTKFPGIEDTIDKLQALGLGMPQLGGEAARVYATVKNVELTGTTLPGSGEMSEFVFDNPAQLADVLAEAQKIVAERQATGTEPIASVFPDDAPASRASPPEEPKDEPVATVAEAFAVAAGETPPKGKKRGPKPKGITAEATVTAVTNVVNVVSETQVEATIHATAASAITDSKAPEELIGAKAINLYVDCIPSCKFESFWPFVNALTGRMAQMYGGDDYRTAKDLDFSKWKGVLAAALRSAYDKNQIPPGNYLLDNTMNDTAAVVIEAMREIVGQSGGLMVRGIR
jgi:hypothetical protein